ncbi:hypothetical protein V1477_002923 [Vespula maculifrons]|uniref:Uncharacterized protein n=1 Tax=Vespula maculifrons TaxID=7453 RepID=A0ABD2CXB2_VESMC
MRQRRHTPRITRERRDGSPLSAAAAAAAAVTAVTTAAVAAPAASASAAAAAVLCQVCRAVLKLIYRVTRDELKFSLTLICDLLESIENNRTFVCLDVLC